MLFTFVLPICVFKQNLEKQSSSVHGGLTEFSLMIGLWFQLSHAFIFYFGMGRFGGVLIFILCVCVNP